MGEVRGARREGGGRDFLFFQKRCQTCVVCVWAGERIRENGPQMAMGSDHTKWEELQWFLDWGLSGNNPTFLWYPFRYTLLAFLFSLTFALGVLSTRREERREGVWCLLCYFCGHRSMYLPVLDPIHPLRDRGGVGRGKRGAQELTKNGSLGVSRGRWFN